jgi:hypothetical protein
VALTAQINELKVSKPDKTLSTVAAKHQSDRKKFHDTNKGSKWFLIPPKPDKPPKQQKGGKDWWCCPNQHAEKRKWVHHDPAICEQPKKSKPAQPATPATKNKEEIAESCVRVKTLMALLNLEAIEENYDF